MAKQTALITGPQPPTLADVAEFVRRNELAGVQPQTQLTERTLGDGTVAWVAPLNAVPQRPLPERRRAKS